MTAGSVTATVWTYIKEQFGNELEYL